MKSNRKNSERQIELIPHFIKQIQEVMLQGVPIYEIGTESFTYSQPLGNPIMVEFLNKVDTKNILGGCTYADIMDVAAHTLKCRANVYRVYNENLESRAWVIGKKNALKVKKEFIEQGISVEEDNKYGLQREIDTEKTKLKDCYSFGFSKVDCINKKDWIKHLEEKLKSFDKRVKAYYEENTEIVEIHKQRG